MSNKNYSRKEKVDFKNTLIYGTQRLNHLLVGAMSMIVVCLLVIIYQFRASRRAARAYKSLLLSKYPALAQFE